MKRSFAPACLLAAAALGQSLTGDWIGGYQQNDNWIVVRGHFDDQAGELRGTMDIVSAKQRGVQLRDVSRQAAALRFRLVSGRREDEFSGTANGGSISGTVGGKSGATSAFQLTRLLVLDQSALRQYDGAYQFGTDHYIYLQMWSEFAGTDELVAFDERGEVRTLYPTNRDSFFAGPGAALPVSVESRVSFQRDTSGAITLLTWQQGAGAPRVARRVATEESEDVRFRNGDVQLAGRLISPDKKGKHPAIILVHGSGPQSREATLPFARFQKLTSRMGGAPPKNVPRSRDDPFWDYMRRIYFYDPVPTLEKLRCPTLAIFGGLDNNVVPEKNRAAWEGALKRGGNPDYKTVVLAGADHDMLAARVGSSVEMPSLQGLVPEYSTTIGNWAVSRNM